MAAFTAISGCSYKAAQDGETISVVDQLGRTATVRRHMTRISALHHFGGRIVFALGQQDKLVEQSLYGREAKALAAVDAKFAAMPKTQAQDGHAINLESLIAFGPQCAVAAAGTIAWVGLIVPHIARYLAGTDHRKLIPASAFLGGTFLLLMDTLARSMLASEIPISIVTSVIGAPFLGYLVLSRKSMGVSGELGS